MTTGATPLPAVDPVLHAVLAALGHTHPPFPPTPDAAHWFQTEALERDMAEARHCLRARKGFVLLTGEVGQGKTTFLRRLLVDLEADGARCSLIFNTFLQGPELLAAVLRDFGLEPGGDAASDIATLNGFLLAAWREGRPCVLFIDDAQNLDPASLELLRLLSNLESAQEKLLQIVLSGQPELEDLLRQHGLRQLASRVVKHVRLVPLDAADLARYLDFRLTRAGDTGRLRIDAAARAVLHRESGGNPRRLHLIMDRCLYGVIASGQPRVDAALVRQAAREAGFAPPRAKARARWMAAGALAVAAGLAAAAGFRSIPETDRATTAAPAAPVAARAPTLPPHAECIARAARDGRPVQVVAVPRDRIAELAAQADVCVGEGPEGAWATWTPPLPLDALVEGARGAAVRSLQDRLVNAGTLVVPPPPGPDPRDGRFGPDTRAAVAVFQAREGLAATGRVDPTTLLLLDVATRRSGPDLDSTEPSNGRG